MSEFNGKNLGSITTILLIVISISFYGCSGIKNFTFQEDLPTIAHVHIGHTVTGWMHTPDKQGLFSTAETEGQIALEEAKKAIERPEDLGNIKTHIKGALHALDPDIIENGPGLGFGLLKGLMESIGHFTYAAKSDDASVNVQQFAVQFEREALPLSDHGDLVVALGNEILALTSAEDAYVLASEVHCYIEAIVNGPDEGNECQSVANAGDVGLKQLRSQIDDMIAREVPEYKTVATRYLFGVIKLPSGQWAFSWLVNPFYDDDDMNRGDRGGY